MGKEKELKEEKELKRTCENVFSMRYVWLVGSELSQKDMFTNSDIETKLLIMPVRSSVLILPGSTAVAAADTSDVIVEVLVTS